MNSIINKTYIYGNHPKGVNHTILIKCTWLAYCVINTITFVDILKE
jgi:hypothetical protein